MPRGSKRRRDSPPASAPAAPSPRAAPAPKPPKRTYDKPCAFLRTWLWKRESKSDEERFDQPYSYPFGPDEAPLLLAQRRFGPEGFASTVWDSSIVLSKYLERRFGAGPAALAGQRVVELGAGCGLVSCVLARLGADVTATDMEPNLPLLRDNLRANSPPEMCDGASGVRVAALLWGADAARRVAAGGPDRDDDAHCLRPAMQPRPAGFQLVVATDVMYVHDAVPALLDALRALSDAPGAEVLLAHGRNRPAEAAFLAAAAPHFAVEEVPEAELHDVYRCLDVTVLCLTPRRGVDVATALD